MFLVEISPNIFFYPCMLYYYLYIPISDKVIMKLNGVTRSAVRVLICADIPIHSSSQNFAQSMSITIWVKKRLRLNCSLWFVCRIKYKIVYSMSVQVQNDFHSNFLLQTDIKPTLKSCCDLTKNVLLNIWSGTQVHKGQILLLIQVVLIKRVSLISYEVTSI